MGFSINLHASSALRNVDHRIPPHKTVVRQLERVVHLSEQILKSETQLHKLGIISKYRLEAARLTHYSYRVRMAEVKDNQEESILYLNKSIKILNKNVKIDKLFDHQLIPRRQLLIEVRFRLAQAMFNRRIWSVQQGSLAELDD